MLIHGKNDAHQWLMNCDTPWWKYEPRNSWLKYVKDKRHKKHVHVVNIKRVCYFLHIHGVNFTWMYNTCK